MENNINTTEPPNKINSFLPFFKRKDILISILSVSFTLVILVLGVYYVRFRQSTGPVHAEGVQVQLVSTNTNVKSGDEFVVDVYIDTKGMSVTASDLRVRYDPQLLQAESITPGNFLPVVLLPQQLTSGFAQIVLGCSVTEPKNGTGIVESVKFKVLGQGATANIYFGPASAIAALGQSTNVMTSPTSLNIIIEAGATALPTPTPLATTAPSPTESPIATAAPLSIPAGSPVGSPPPAPVPPGGTKPGDVNGDGIVNVVDIGIIIDNYGKNPIPDPRADLSGDGNVNVVDIGIVVDNYGK